jgi:hypothetical protein
MEHSSPGKDHSNVERYPGSAPSRPALISRSRLRVLPGDRRGAVVVVFVLMLMPLLGMVAVVIDVGYLLAVRGKLQATADASALAAASALPSSSQAVARAQAYAELNYPGAGNVMTPDDVTLGHWNGLAFTAGGTPSNAVRVIAARRAARGNEVTLLLAPILGKKFRDVGASAIALREGSENGTRCIWVLGPANNSRNAGINIQNNNTVLHAPECDIHINVTGSSALSVSSGGAITGKSIDVVGGATISNPQLVKPYPVNTGAAPAPDPLLGKLTPPPNVTAPCDVPSRLIVTSTRTLSPGVYCGGISSGSGGDITFEPGVYVIRGGDLGGGVNLHAGASGRMRGTGVTFYLTCKAGPCTPAGTEKANVEFESGATLDLRAPASGPYKGILFYQDRNLKGTNSENLFQSGSGSVLDGVFYFPTQALRFQSGSGSTALQRVALVATYIWMTSAANLTFGELTHKPDALAGERLMLVQ